MKILEMPPIKSVRFHWPTNSLLETVHLRRPKPPYPIPAIDHLITSTGLHFQNLHFVLDLILSLFSFYFGSEMSSLFVFDLIRLFFLVAGFRSGFCAREIVGVGADLAADAAVDLNLTSFNGALKESPASYAVVEFFANWFVDLPTSFWFTVCVVVSVSFVGFRWILFWSVVRQSVI